MNAIVILVVVAVVLLRNNNFLKSLLQRIKAKIFSSNAASIFDHQYLEGKAFFLYRFRRVPCITLVEEIDVNQTYAFINTRYGNEIADIYQNCYYNHAESVQQFCKTLFVLNNKVMIELGGQYCRVLYVNSRFGFANHIVKELSAYKLPEKQQAFEINIITFSNGCLDLKPLPIQPTQLELSLYYNDDFIVVDRLIRERLNTAGDKGIVLLHGIPGTGKTTYLRHLVGQLNKKVLFLSPSVAGNLMNPDFIDLLVDHPNTVLVIEDAENIMMDRKVKGDSSVSNLLNLSDGLLSDCLNVQIICTFNSHLNLIDSALMRKGRLIARYEFGKLSAEKARQLSDHLGFEHKICAPMTIAEITSQDELINFDEQPRAIGFRMN